MNPYYSYHFTVCIVYKNVHGFLKAERETVVLKADFRETAIKAFWSVVVPNHFSQKLETIVQIDIQDIEKRV